MRSLKARQLLQKCPLNRQSKTECVTSASVLPEISAKERFQRSPHISPCLPIFRRLGNVASPPSWWGKTSIALDQNPERIKPNTTQKSSKNWQKWTNFEGGFRENRFVEILTAVESDNSKNGNWKKAHVGLLWNAYLRCQTMGKFVCLHPRGWSPSHISDFFTL